MGDFSAHWSARVMTLAEQNKLELIKVPPGTTARAQPLDLELNALMKQKRQALWVEQKKAGLADADSAKQAVLRSLAACQDLKTKQIQHSWTKLIP